MASILNKLTSLEKQLVVFGIGGYTLWSFGMALKGESKHAHSEPATQNSDVQHSTPPPIDDKTLNQKNFLAEDHVSLSKFSEPTDSLVLSALHDIQSRLSVIEKAVKP